jgi:hypothetical protein
MIRGRKEGRLDQMIFGAHHRNIFGPRFGLQFTRLKSQDIDVLYGCTGINTQTCQLKIDPAMAPAKCGLYHTLDG